MRYIRTKDGRIIDLDREVYGTKVVHLDQNQIDGGNWAGWYWYFEENGYYESECRDLDILKQADTIEELCDEFVMVGGFVSFTFRTGKYGLYDGLDKSEMSKSMHKELQEKGYQFYGAIWTDKGLIYVAKMNEKGELELL